MISQSIHLLMKELGSLSQIDIVNELGYIGVDISPGSISNLKKEKGSAQLCEKVAKGLLVLINNKFNLLFNEETLTFVPSLNKPLLIDTPLFFVKEPESGSQLITYFRSRADAVSIKLESLLPNIDASKFMSQFTALHQLHIATLEAGNNVAAHQVFWDILTLSKETQAQEDKEIEPKSIYDLLGNNFYIKKDNLGVLLSLYLTNKSELSEDWIEFIKKIELEKDATNTMVYEKLLSEL